MRRRTLRRRYGRQAVGVMSALRNMETARKAYRNARAAGRSPRSAHTAAFNMLRHDLGIGAWDLATRAQREYRE
jgi:hypothetical protein